MHAQVAIALSLLTAEVTKPPFNKIICTFSSLPELHLVQGNTLMEQVGPPTKNNIISASRSLVAACPASDSARTLDTHAKFGSCSGEGRRRHELELEHRHQRCV